MSMRKFDAGDGQRVALTLIIRVWDDGALSVEGPIEDKVWALAALENAKDAVRNHRNPGCVDVVVPARNVSLA